MSIEEMRHERQLVDYKIKEITNDLGIKRFRGEKIDEEYKRDCEIRIRKLKQDFMEWARKFDKKEQASPHPPLRRRKVFCCPSYMLSIPFVDEDDYIPLGDIIARYCTSKAITPDLPIEEPDNSLNMGDEHLDTTPSIENLVPILSEFEGISDETSDRRLTCPTIIVSIRCDPNDDTSSDDDDFEDVEYVSLEEVNDDQEEKKFNLEDIFQIQDVILREKLLNVHRLISNIESLKVNSTPDRVGFQTIDGRSSDSTTTHANYSLPEYDSFLFEIEPDQEGLISNDNSNDPFLELPEFESFHFDPSFPRPPPEPPDVEICLHFEPDAPVIDNFNELNDDQRGSEIDFSQNIEMMIPSPFIILDFSPISHLPRVRIYILYICIDLDGSYKNFKIVEQDIKKFVGASSRAQNLAFMTTLSTSSTNDVNTANPAYEFSTVSPNINTACPQVSTANFSDNIMYAFMVENPNGSNLLQQDLEQIHKDDLEAMDLKWQLSLLCMRAKRYFQRTRKKIFINTNDTAGYDKSKVKCFNCHKMGYFARECRAPRNKEGQFKYQDSTRKQGNNKDTSSKAMLAIDGVGFDWSDMAEEQVQTNMALIAFSDSEVVNYNFTTTGLTPNASKGKPQQDDTRFIDSGCSRHMTGNIAYLSDFKEFDGGYVTFGGGAYGGRISGKGTLKTDSLDFEDLSDESQILLKIPRKDNMYSFDMKNIISKESLTCLVAKATLDESMLWHRRLGHINSKNINKLVKENLVRGLPLKHFENDQTCVACLKGKQHKAFCKSKILNPITKPLFMLHMDLFGPTFVSSLMHKKYCLVVTDDYSRFTWVFFLETKDETCEILKNFIKEIENLVDKKVKIIRCDNGTEFKNKVIDDFCKVKGIRREYSVARTPQQNGVAERRNRKLVEAARTIGFKPALSFMRPFGCHVTILNTLDHLGKFDGKSDEGFFVGYSLSSKAFRIYNNRTRKVEESLHIGFLENKPMREGNGPKWLFDIDSLTQSINYVPVAVGTITNESADASYFDSSSKDDSDDEPKPSSDRGKKIDEGVTNASVVDDQERPESSTLNINTARPSINTASANFRPGSLNINTKRIARDTEIAKQLQEEFDRVRQEQEVVAEVDQAHDIDWSDPIILRYYAVQNRSFSKAEVRKNMCMYLKNQGGYKLSHFKGMKYEDIRPIFERVWDQNQSFVPMDSELEVQRLKRAGQNVVEEPAKRQRTREASGSVQEQTGKESKAEELSQEQLH
ncbi:putative ribonuclease H-like domain-containing protein [Tanacetum coccineum]